MMEDAFICEYFNNFAWFVSSKGGWGERDSHQMLIMRLLLLQLMSSKRIIFND